MLFSSILALLLVAAVQCDDQKSYEGWSVLKVHPDNDDQVQYLNSLRENDSGFDLQVWQQGSTSRPFDIFICPAAKDKFLEALDALSIRYETTSENVQRAIDAEKVPAPGRTRASIPNGAWFSKFLKLEEINTAVQQLAKSYPNLVQLETFGKTHEGRPLTVVKLSSNTRAGNKPGIWLDGGIHAREWASPATVLYILNKLVTGYSSNSGIKSLVDGATWYIVPVLNPDGYAYTHAKDRMWRKNRRPGSGGCPGVDLNRNFGYGFGGAGTSTDPCDDTYRGPSAFSEPESKAARDYILSHKDLKAYLTIHAYSQMWFFPYGDKVNSYPPDADELEALAQKGAAALASLYGTQYDVGTAADLLYEAAGGSDDWAKGNANIKYVYTLELRPSGNAPGNGFILPPSQIVPTAEETWAGLSVVANAVVSKN